MARTDCDNPPSEHPYGATAAAANGRRAQIEKIVALTRSMRARVQAGAWDDIVAMETERQELLNAFFAVEPTKAEAAWIAESIQEMLRINAEMEEACRRHLLEITSDMRKLHSAP